MQAKTIKLSDLHLNTGQIKDVPKNPRFIKDERYEALKKSIYDDPEMLQLRELVAYDNNGELVVILGNMRYRAMKELGYKDAPVKVLPAETDAKKLRAYIQKDNIAFGQNDWDLLGNEWDIEELQDFGLECEFLEEMETETEKEKEAEEDNYDIENNIEEETTTKIGDCFKLGEHRLLCGDSTNQENVRFLCDGNYVDLLVTDPPYNVAYKSLNKKLAKKSIENDNMPDVQFKEFLDKAFSCAEQNLKKGGAFYIWHADLGSNAFREAVRDSQSLILKQCLIWNKNLFTLGRQDYQWKHEPCLYGWKDGASHYFTERRDLSTVIDKLNEIDVDKASKVELQGIVRTIQNESDVIQTTILNEDKPQHSDLHPTMKPVKLIAKCIQNSSRPNEIVLDLFGGSGTTLIAAEQLGRKCYMMEYDPHFVDVIIKRWEELTGKKAIKLGNMQDKKQETK